MSLHLNATLNGLTTKLLNYANLTVLDTTGITNNLVRFASPPFMFVRLPRPDPRSAGEHGRLSTKPLYLNAPHHQHPEQRHPRLGTLCGLDHGRHGLLRDRKASEPVARPRPVRAFLN